MQTAQVVTCKVAFPFMWAWYGCWEEMSLQGISACMDGLSLLWKQPEVVLRGFHFFFIKQSCVCVNPLISASSAPRPKNFVLLLSSEGKRCLILAGTKAENCVSPRAEANRCEQCLTYAPGFRVPSQITCLIVQHFWMLSCRCLKGKIGFLFKTVTLPTYNWHLPRWERKS